MSDKEAKSPVQCDVLVAGAGAAGLSAAHAFAAQGRKVVVVGKVETHLAGRTVALFEGSLRFFRALGLWKGLADHAAPMEGIRLIDDTGSIFPTTPKEFRSPSAKISTITRWWPNWRKRREKIPTSRSLKI